MTNFVSSVRFTAKPGQTDILAKTLSAFELPDGALNHIVVHTGGESFCTFLMWRDEQDLVNARPALISFLDTVRDLLQELSPELGVTDPVSGPVITNIHA